VNYKLAWKVTGQVHDQVIPTDAGQALTGTYVYFVTGLGEKASVFVEDKVYGTDAVKNAVHAHARKVDEVRRLTEGDIGDIP
jgi:hypothetical protein